MENKKEEIEEIFLKLTDENQKVINLVAKGMEIAQENAESEKHIPRID